MELPEKKKTILIADDNPDNLKVLSQALADPGYEIRIAMDGKEAVESAETQLPDIILLDIHMPEMDGYDACARLKRNPRTRDIPVIFISTLNKAFNKIKAFELGAVDYLTKPIHMEETRARVNIHLQLRQKINELEKFNKIMLDREMRILDLKKEVNALASELDKKEPYPEIWSE